MTKSARSREQPEMPSSLLAVLGEEFKALHGDAGLDDSSLAALYRSIHELKEPQAALCFSGGGIRSASFGLGVLQGLARRGLLLDFHYLSTVSGGGYIGSWLSAWRRHAGNDAAVLQSLTTRRADPPDEPLEIASLRADSNYLTPQLGLLSADTWTAVALYIRNLLLNWLVLVPIFAAALLVPLAASRFLDWASCWPLGWRWVTLGAGVVLIGTGHTIAIASRPGEGRRGISQTGFLMLVLLPIYLGATSLAVFAAQGASKLMACNSAPPWTITPLRAVILGAAVYAISWILGFMARRRGALLAGLPHRSSEEDPVPPWKRWCLWTLVGALAGWLVWLGLDFWVEHPPVAVGALWKVNPPAIARDTIVVFGVAWIVLALMVAEMLYVGLASYTRNGDADREWLARAAGWTAAVTVLWLCFSGLVLFGPALTGDFIRWVVPLLGGVSGIAGALIGQSAKTAASIGGKNGKSLPLGQIGRVAAVIFLLSLALVLSFILVPLLDLIAAALGLAPNSWGPFLVAVFAVGLLALFSIGTSYLVNVNRFSLHAVYRNRLVRAFLGAARCSAHRHPDAFTGFDIADNVPMHKLWRPQPGSPEVAPRLLHVINMTLNVVHSTNLAWQQRKAETFTVTPFATGNPYVGYRSSTAYAQGISLGTAMAISGAAASPNMGYHTSPLIGLMMTLFNLRLGWWFGNPNHKNTWRGEGPTVGVSAIVRELFGLTDDESPYVYLSDGGHFENLGLYEMVRRRCRYIVVSDAGCDPDCALADLGNAIRKIWIDLGIKIDFPCFDIKPRPALTEGAPSCNMPRSGSGDDPCYCAVGTIRYPEDGAPPGHLLYIKPTLTGAEPADIRSYAAESPDFPHESTSDQWFSESQLESYRSLGSYIVDRIWDESMSAGEAAGLAGFIERGRAHATRQRATPVPRGADAVPAIG